MKQPLGEVGAVLMDMNSAGGEAADAPTDLERRSIAASVVQRTFRNRSSSIAWSTLLANVPKLRAAYIDQDAMAAGASSNPLYSDRMLAAREKLRDDPLVIRALDAAWESLVPAGRTTLSRKLYYTVRAALLFENMLRSMHTCPALA